MTDRQRLSDAVAVLRREAAARALYNAIGGDLRWEDNESRNSWRSISEDVLAAADAAERPIAQKLADAIRSDNHRKEAPPRSAPLRVYCAVCGRPWPCESAQALVEWDATQEQPT